ncbi:MAG: transcription-repair coupling factor [Legionellales bacterium]|nr:transcription-repair coupling factor [Legionellales bacterium]
MTISKNLFTLSLPTHAGEPIQYGQLFGSSIALALAEVLGKSQQSALIICQDTLAAQRIENELAFFIPDQKSRIMSFPDWETLPYDSFSPHQDIISERIATLYRLLNQPHVILIVPVTTLMHFIGEKTFIERTSLYLKTGDKLSIGHVRQQFEKRGYRCVNQVYEHGEFAVRGSILDIYPMGANVPYRIDLFDDEIDTIREFDPETQLSQGKIKEINLLPALEFPFDEVGVSLFRQNWRASFEGNPLSCPLYERVSQGMLAGGIEYYLPLFYQQAGTLFDYLPEDCLLVRIDEIKDAADHFWQEVSTRFTQCNIDRTKPLLKPDKLFLRPDQLLGACKQFKQIQLNHSPFAEAKTTRQNLATASMPEVQVNHKLQNPLINLQTYLADFHGRLLFCVESAGRREALLALLQTIAVHPRSVDSWKAYIASEERYSITIAPLDEGVNLPEQSLLVITEAQLFGSYVLQQRRRKSKKFDAEQSVRNLAELSIGNPIVHLEHGVGRYLGLQLIKAGDVEGEYLTIEYAGGDKIYIPVTSLHLISRYSGMDMDHAPLNRLGTNQWQKAKEKAAEQVRDVAAELLDLYAKRAARAGFRFNAPDDDYTRFSAGFPFEETPDQADAIQAVLTDMQSGRPMDRLVCGDVGFGKTEVAMRAAFMAVNSNKQVAVLVPTTLLAQQHYETFSDRFADWPINIAALSRFQTAKQKTTVLEKLNKGDLDIVIGTHTLIQDKIKFQRLGLLIIDEEHRFGVHQKEKLKALRSEVDILTLTATPIPRTLNMAMSNLRELSIIATPPARRLSVKTFLHERSNTLIREALLREILRGGQVYFLHNDVESIDRVASELTTLLPEARINIAHGQMHERELEHVMTEFYHQRFNVLVCTTIIETGIDVPTANTIVIDRADKFGLAQLHQLRGRVGRSHHQAYAYLLVPPEKKLTKDAEKRLEAITVHDALGVGFVLATHDLEIRGAGELLGDNQSGNIQAIGFHLYMEMLEKTVEAIKSGKTPDKNTSVFDTLEVELKIPALIPSDYLDDVHERLVWYKRISSIKNEAELHELKVQMIDRFGLLPRACQNLFEMAQIKLQAQVLGVKKIEANPSGGRIEFQQDTRVEPITIIKLIQQKAHTFQMESSNRLRFKLGSDTAEKRIEVVKSVLALLR